jgi:GTP-binding protein Era
MENENICDINLLIIDVTKKIEKKSFELIKELLEICDNNFLVLNKIDLIERSKLLEISKLINEKLNFKNTFMISAKKGQGVKFLLNEILNLIPFKPWIFKNNKQSTDKDIIFQISEITREKIFQLINKEIPYTVKIETSLQKNKKIYIIEQKILVKKTSHKSIIIGKMGDKIKEIGSRARLDIEKILKSKVFLKLNVAMKSK